MEDYGLLPIHHDEIVRIYNEWNHGGHFLATASPREFISIDLLTLVVYREVKKLQSSQVWTLTGNGDQKLTHAKLEPALGYLATWLSAVIGLIGAKLCPPDLISNRAIPDNCLVPLNALAKLALIGGPLGVIWIAAYHRDRLVRAFARRTAANRR